MKQTIDARRDNLARRLKEAREYLGLSQEYVAQQTKISRAAISEIELGRRKVESLELKVLATLYGRPLDYFLGEEQEPNESASRSSKTARLPKDQTDVKLRNMTKTLPPEDREEILRFVEYLRHKKLASRNARSDGER